MLTRVVAAALLIAACGGAPPLPSRHANPPASPPATNSDHLPVSPAPAPSPAPLPFTEVWTVTQENGNYREMLVNGHHCIEHIEHNPGGLNDTSISCNWNEGH